MLGTISNLYARDEKDSEIQSRTGMDGGLDLDDVIRET